MGAYAMTKEYLTIEEIADSLSVSQFTVQKWIANGELIAYKLGKGRAYRIAPADLDSFLESRRTGKKTQGEHKQEEE